MMREPMPIYEFRCKKCGETFEALCRIGDEGSDLVCPTCGTKAPEKIFSVFAAAGSCGPTSTGFG
jgi:putative FmdB family regulatory protein